MLLHVFLSNYLIPSYLYYLEYIWHYVPGRLYLYLSGCKNKHFFSCSWKNINPTSVRDIRDFIVCDFLQLI